jgi:protein-S-isoprenylcysteine O-methyltransferase Ste14
MSNETLFRLITFLVFTTALTVSGYFRRRADREAGRLNDPQGARLVRVLRLYGLIALAPFFAYLINPDWVAWARFSLPDSIRWVAAIVAASMIPVIYWILASLGHNISPMASAREGATLITHGPYRWVRHPLYTAGTIVLIALTALTAMWWVAAAFLPAAFVLVWRTGKEEAKLIEAFGDEYRVYMQRTGRFFPRLLS